MKEDGVPSPPFSPRSLAVLAAVLGAFAACFLLFRHIFPASHTWPQGWYNPFDAGIMRYVNRFADRSMWLNQAALTIEGRKVTKGGPIVLLFWIAFFQRSSDPQETLHRRRTIAATVPTALFGVVLARVLAHVLPFRERPLRTAALHFELPHAVHHALPTQVLYGWSSFPSDHAVLFVTLGVGLLLASRLLGSLALLYICAVILPVRIFLGLHWPTDLLAGAALGVALAFTVTIAAYRDAVWRFALRCWQNFPGLSAGFIFYLSYEIIDMFEFPLTLAKGLMKHLLHR